MKKLIVLVAVGMLAVLLSSSPVAAGGKGGGKPGGSTTTTGNLTVSPVGTLAAYGTAYTVAGSGFYPNQIVAFSVADPGCCVAFNYMSDGSGHVSFSRTTGYPGTYIINAYQMSGNRYVLMATVSFPVQ